MKNNLSHTYFFVY